MNDVLKLSVQCSEKPRAMNIVVGLNLCGGQKKDLFLPLLNVHKNMRALFMGGSVREPKAVKLQNNKVKIVTACKER